MAGAVPDLGDVAIDIRVVSAEPAERLAYLFEVWKERCPIYLALLKPLEVTATFSAA
jgi:hypothetical protein